MVGIKPYHSFFEKLLDKNIKMCYTYDALGRVTQRRTVNLCDSSSTTESFSYDAAGNVTTDGSSAYVYDTNNRLVSFNGNTVSYDLDGNMLNNGALTCTYDSSNRLVSAGGHTYTYNAENVRIRNLCEDEDTSYVYNTNCKLSQLLMKTTDNTVTKYVYGLGLIGEECENVFKTYHFDFRGSTVAITDASGNITDTFAYDTYGKLTERTGTSDILFLYNGRDGVVTDKNGLIYMRARYYSPEMKRFVNADIVAGSIDNAITLNRFAYANGNPVSFVDPFGLSSERESWYGAHHDTKTTFTSINNTLDLTLGLNIITLHHKQTITTTKRNGTEGLWFDAYSYSDINITDEIGSVGLGLKLLYLFGFDINFKLLGAEAEFSINAENVSIYANIDINLLSDSSASVGIINEVGHNTEVNNQYGITGNTAAVVFLVLSIVTGVQMFSAGNPAPAPTPVPVPAGAN